MPRVLTASDLEDFRSRVCTAAMELFVERGHDGFNMRELAARLNVSAMTAYRYFANKADIMAAVRAREFDRLAERLESAADGGEPGIESFTAVCRAYVDFAREEPMRYQLMFDLTQPQGSRTAALISAEKRVHEAFVTQAWLPSVVGIGAERIAQLAWASLHGLVALACMQTYRGLELDVFLAESIQRFAGLADRRVLATTFDSRGAGRDHLGLRTEHTDGVASASIPLTAAE